MRESLDAKRRRARKIIRALKKAYPDAKIALDFSNPLELLVATILAAQCTDERVNRVTPALFAKYRTARDWAQADLGALERLIHSTGFFRAKARVPGLPGPHALSLARQDQDSLTGHGFSNRVGVANFSVRTPT